MSKHGKKSKKLPMTDAEKSKWRGVSETNGATWLRDELVEIFTELGCDAPNVANNMRAVACALAKLVDARPGALEVVDSLPGGSHGEIMAQLSRVNGRVACYLEDDENEASLPGIFLGAVRGLARQLKLPPSQSPGGSKPPSSRKLPDLVLDKGIVPAPRTKRNGAKFKKGK